jgi:hypothetical protein
MSFEAVAWAMKQKLPPLPKFVLVALCERANPDTGECWPGIKTVAKAVCLSERSVITYISALVRNGYVMRQSMRAKDGRKRTNHYWILFDRADESWVGPGGKIEEIPTSEADEEEAAAVAAEPESSPCADLAHGHLVQAASHGPCAPACVPHIELEPPLLEPSESEILDTPPLLAGLRPHPEQIASTPLGFDPNNRQRELERIRAAEEARKPKTVFVIHNSRAWSAWCDYKRAEYRAKGDPRWNMLSEPIPTTCHNGKTGWWLPTLFPPARPP